MFVQTNRNDLFIFVPQQTKNRIRIFKKEISSKQDQAFQFAIVSQVARDKNKGLVLHHQCMGKYKKNIKKLFVMMIIINTKAFFRGGGVGGSYPFGRSVEKSKTGQKPALKLHHHTDILALTTYTGRKISNARRS